MVPASGRNSPAIWATSVVLPAPFGPITAWTSLSATSSARWSVATRPPKRFTSPAMARIGSATAGAPHVARNEAEDAALGEQHDQDQERPEDDEPMLGQRRQLVLEEDIDGGAEDGAEQRANAAEDHHDDDLARARPMHDRRRHEEELVCQQRTGDAAHRRRDDEGGEAIAEDRKADRRHPPAVRLGAAQH